MLRNHQGQGQPLPLVLPPLNAAPLTPRALDGHGKDTQLGMGERKYAET